MGSIVKNSALPFILSYICDCIVSAKNWLLQMGASNIDSFLDYNGIDLVLISTLVSSLNRV